MSRTAPKKERAVKFIIQQYRNPSITEEEFHTYWSKKHAALASPWLVRHGILKYAQYHTTTQTRTLVSPMAASRSWKVADFDGQVEILCRSFEDVITACADPEYPGKIGRDEKRFIDHARSVASVGWEEVYVEDGRVVDFLQGKEEGEREEEEEEEKAGMALAGKEAGLSTEELVCRMACGLYYFFVLVVFCWQVLGRGAAAEW
ncbi:hypothetical protein L873DRAFT_564302 [Choiromyces venosus 120613-1]|uniref:EthD domain-containing protein n=1 Tax=Choiromyces venosus 120613-1 TaxID=1336337 RepID=A0A3N4JUR4_9PEZI|nr:hypothetical protein L873DRAFT_564302 [Choiromyces venosus 120613-1]